MRQRIESLEQFRALQAEYMAAREAEKRKILVCCGTGCVAGGNLNVYHELKKRMDELGIPCEVSLTEHHDDSVGLKKSGCHGFCEMGPLVRIEPEGWLYTKCQVSDVEEIIQKTILGGQFIERLGYNRGGELYERQEDIPFYKRQTRRVLEHCGHIDAESIEEYLSIGGYGALAKALFEMQPDEIVQVVSDSGLRGRGGAGFPTGVKWTFIPPNNTKPVYLVCNCDESEPGTFKDRYIVHQDPHQLIEGMVISSYAVGAHLAYIYMREEFPIAAETMLKALQEARERGFLGKNILGSGYDLEIHLHRGAGAYICGEETALLNSLEGVRPYPRIKPPYFPAAIGLYGCPTIVNNVESLCQVKHVIAMGGEAYGQEGAKRSPGTRIIGVSGDVQRPGYYEIVSGSMTFGELLYDVCGGPREGREFKAVIPGGSSSKVMRTDVEYKTRNPDGTTGKISFFDIPLDLDSIAQYGSMSGSGAVIVMDDSRSMPWALNNINRFYAHESCGQCTPCREGCPWMMKLSTRILEGKGAPSDVDLLIQVANQIEGKTVCAFGEAASWPTQAMVSKFKEEFVALTDPFNACLPHSAEGREQRRYFIR